MRALTIVAGLLLLGGGFLAGRLLAPPEADDALRAARAESTAAHERIDELEDALAATHQLAKDQQWLIEQFPRPEDCVLPLPRTQPPVQPASARILAADTQRNVYVISAGSEDGVRVGTKCLVSRDGHWRAFLEITDVQHGQAAGKITLSRSNEPIARGDLVTVDVRNSR